MIEVLCVICEDRKLGGGISVPPMTVGVGESRRVIDDIDDKGG